MSGPGAPRLLNAVRGLPVDRPPVWFMRQAGRYLPEYRKVRETHSLLDICRTPDLATEVTLQPIRRFGFDAAILFADILLPVIPLGFHLEFVEGLGPVIDSPIRSVAQIDSLPPVHPEESLGYVLEAVRSIRATLPESVPLIGFAGAPFTVASYLIEGGPSKNFIATKQLMLSHPEAFGRLLSHLARLITDLVTAQVDAGAQVIQIFDSWVGVLSADQYRTHVQPPTRTVFEALERRRVPSIHFGVGASTILEDMRDTGGDVIGLDWRIALDHGWTRVGNGNVQGNLDPAVLFAPEPVIRQATTNVLERAGDRPGHIFNLGHGILPGTPIDAVHTVLETVRGWSNRTV